MIPVNTRVLQVPCLVSPWVIAPSYAEHTWGICPAQLLISVCSLAVPEGNDYLDGEDVYHHWLPPLVPSLADRWRGSQAGETSASVLSTAAHAGSLLRGRCGQESGHKKTLEAWLSVCAHVPIEG